MEKVKGKTKVLILSDIHFGEKPYPGMLPPSQKIQIVRTILKKEIPDKIILAGDILNRLYSIGAESEYQKRQKFLRLFKNYDTTYIGGDHDKRPNKRMAKFLSELGIQFLPKYSGVEVGKFYICHGNEVKKFGIMTKRKEFQDLTFEKLKPYLKQLKDKLQARWLLCGHFHTSGFSKRLKVAVIGTLQMRTWNNTDLKHTYAIIDFSEHKQGWLEIKNYPLLL